MQVLLIEDDENKRGQLTAFIRERLPHAEIVTAASYHSGLACLQGRRPELLLLDMTIPTFDIGAEESGGRSRLYGGREILEQMDRFDIALPVIVVTQFDRFGDQENATTLHELDQQLATEFGDVYLGAVYYNSAREDWKTELGERIQMALICWDLK